MTSYGRGRSGEGKIHLQDATLRTWSACGKSSVRCVSADTAQIIDCKACLKILQGRVVAGAAK